MSESKRTSVHERLYIQTTVASAPKLAKLGEPASMNRPVLMNAKTKDEAQGKIIYLLSYDEKYPEKEKIVLTENMKKDGSRPRHDLKRKAETMGVNRGLKVLVGPSGQLVCNTGKMASLDLEAVRTGNCYLVLNASQYAVVKATDAFSEKLELLRQAQEESVTSRALSPASSGVSLSPVARSPASSRSSTSSTAMSPTASTDVGTRLSQHTTAASEGRHTGSVRSRNTPTKSVVSPSSKDEPCAKTIYLLDYDEKTPRREALVLVENAKRDGSRPRHDIKRKSEAMGVGAGQKLLINVRGKIAANTAKIENLDVTKIETNDCFWVIQTALHSVVKGTQEYKEKIELLVRSQEEQAEEYRLKRERAERQSVV